MNTCKECVHADDHDADSDTVMCQAKLPRWIKIELASWDRVVFTNAAQDCPTYQPREEREAQP